MDNRDQYKDVRISTGSPAENTAYILKRSIYFLKLAKRDIGTGLKDQADQHFMKVEHAVRWLYGDINPDLEPTLKGNLQNVYTWCVSKIIWCRDMRTDYFIDDIIQNLTAILEAYEEKIRLEKEGK
jgi:flagellin-specific chaperone FliS